jgi:hypothetical protein
MVENRHHKENNKRSVLYQMNITNAFAEKNPETVKTLSKHHLIYSIGGLFLGILCVLGGVVLFLNGVTGSTNWTAKFIGAESKINDAAPGAVLFIVGLFIVFITRYVFKINK